MVLSPLPFYTSRKKAIQGGFNLARAAADRIAVASVQASASSMSDTSLKVRERIAKVNRMLAEGKNPYTSDQLKQDGKNLGGTNAKDRVINYEALTAESEEAYKLRLDKWSERPEPIYKAYIDDLDLRSDAEKLRDPFKLYCSFCGDHIPDPSRATEGKGAERMIRKDEIIPLPNGLNTIETRFLPMADKIVACPDCSLKVTKVKFPLGLDEI